MTPVQYWPYDEVTMKVGLTPAEIVIDTPWIHTSVVIEEKNIQRAHALVTKFASGHLSGEDLAEVNWFFQALDGYPLCYILPGPPSPSGVSYTIKNHDLVQMNPTDFLTKAADLHHQSEINEVVKHDLFKEWKWDAQGALGFATFQDGIDPKALFSVARRFHILNALENDETDRLYAYTNTLKDDKAMHLKVSSLMVRQNHYVTQQCGASLMPALEMALVARDQVQHFINEEHGHDRIIGAALKSLVSDPESVPVVPQTKLLMDLLKFAAKRNFLAFSIVVDAFERSSYQESDPLAEVLEAGGHSKAAKQIDNHKSINDAGEHENLALGFIERMAPVTAEYALEALRIAETTSNLMSLVSSGVRKHL